MENILDFSFGKNSMCSSVDRIMRTPINTISMSSMRTIDPAPQSESLAKIVDTTMKIVGSNYSRMVFEKYDIYQDVIVRVGSLWIQQILHYLIQNTLLATFERNSSAENKIVVIIHPMRRKFDRKLLGTSKRIFVGVTVSSDGVSMSGKILQQIAKQFFTASSNDEVCGLFMATYSAEFYEGTLIAHTRHEKGTQCTLCLPVDEGAMA
jgi:C4-dicarboxylate-specific signal transduction histidine kinase